MSDAIAQALAAARSLRSSHGYASLTPGERDALDRDLAKIESALATQATADPYAVTLETPGDLGRGPMFRPPGQQPPPSQTPAPARPPRPAGTEVIGQRARAALEAVDFPEFVAELITGTFQAIVDATTRQVREYAKLVADLAQSVDAFSRGNVSPNQVRDWLGQRHPDDLVVQLPKTGEEGAPKLLPRNRSPGSPTWLEDYGLGGEDLTEELTEGRLLDAARPALGEERMQSLATMVLMGVNRIVVDDGEIKARLQFHASAREKVRADVTSFGVAAQGIGSQQIQPSSAVSTKVSTVSVNAQADVAVRANLVGEVAIKFRSETFDLERFADSQAIELINRHSRLRQTEPATGNPTAPTPSEAAT